MPAHSFPESRAVPLSFSSVVCCAVVWVLVGAGLSTPARAQDAPVPVSFALVTQSNVYDEVPLTGTVSPWRSTFLSARLEGSIAELMVEVGDEVAAGDVILVLDPTMAKIELGRVRAELEEARVRYSEAVRQRDEVLQLVEKKHVADTTAASAESEVALYAAGVQRLEAELRREQEILVRHRVFAPFAGVVSEKLVEVGGWVQTSTDLVRLVEIDRLRVEVPVPQRHFMSVDTQTPVLIEFDALPAFSYRGLVTTRVPVSDNAARTFPVHIEIDNRQRLIAPGMSARALLQLNHVNSALLLPKDAVLRDSDGNESVWVIKDEDGMPSSVNVTIETGRNVKDWVELIEGDLLVGARVVVHGNENLSDGQALTLTKEIRPAT